MHWSRRIRAIAHTSLWVSVIAAFLYVSVPKIFRGASKNTIHFMGPFHSSDSFLHFAAGATNGSQRLITLFDSLPLSGSILIFIDGNDRRSSFLGMMIAYLAWPHPVRIISVARTGPGRDLSATDAASVAAVVFCRVNGPSWFPHGKRFGEALEVVPIGKVAER
jgi:hypothetical protein